MKTIALAAALLLAAAASARADFSSSANGTTGADFLNLAVGARAVGMGQAYSAVADDADALYWNPAGLTAIPKIAATFMHAPYLAGSYFDYAAYGQNLGQYGALGAGLQYFSLGGLSQTDATGSSIGSSSPYDLALSFGYAYRATYDDAQMAHLPVEGFSAGLNLKFIQSKIVTTAQTFAVDLGLQSPRYLDDKLSGAFVVQNLGGSLKFDQASENLPINIKFGGAYRLYKPWLVSSDLVLPQGGNPYVALGTEYLVFDDGVRNFAARAGYNSQTLQSISGFSGLAFGFGMGWGNARFDYGLAFLGGLGQAHRLSLSYRFGRAPAESRSTYVPQEAEASASAPAPAPKKKKPARNKKTPSPQQPQDVTPNSDTSAPTWIY